MSPIVPSIILALLIVGVVLYMRITPKTVIQNAAESVESFTDNIPNVSFCPLNSTATILQSGETHCCVGKSSKKFGCLEKTVCTLSASPNGKIPSCGAIVKKYYAEQAAKHCYPAMPNYYEKQDQNGLVTERGCYSGPSNIDLSGPANKTQPTCFVDYSNYTKVASDPKSCFNAKRLAAKNCPAGIKCTKTFIETGKGTPLLLQVGWVGKRQMFGKEMDAPVSTFTVSSVIDYWNKVWPEWYKNINWNAFTAADLATFFYEPHRDLLEGRHARQETNLFWRYIDYYVRKGAAH